MDEFRSIADLFRPLTFGAPEALNLMDDAAAIPSRPGFDLIVTKDALVEGMHFLSDDPPGVVARKLLRVNLSDLAAKGAKPYAYFLAAAWPENWNASRRAAFSEGLAEDQRRFGLKLFGGDTVSTPGPLTLCVTMLGWTPAGGMIKRSGAKAGDVLLVSGTIGDGHLGLAVAQGLLGELSQEARAFLMDRYRLPQPRIALRVVLRRHATAAADVSDGLLADAGHIGEASELGVRIDLERLPLSPAAEAWVSEMPNPVAALVTLATGGDDYEIVCAANSDAVDEVISEAAAVGVPLRAIGRLTTSRGVEAFFHDREVKVSKRGWTHP